MFSVSAFIVAVSVGLYYTIKAIHEALFTVYEFQFIQIKIAKHRSKIEGGKKNEHFHTTRPPYERYIENRS